MNLCNSNHDEVCYEGKECPCCELNSQISSLEDEVSTLNDDISALKSELAEKGE